MAETYSKVYNTAMTSWAKQRQMYYGAGVVAFLLLIIVPTTLIILHEDPTCFDGKQNQKETAIDKGGPCKLLNENTLDPLSVEWARSFAVRDGVYNAVAYVENSNPKSGIESMTYQFKLYSERNVLIAERFGRVAVLPGRVMPILEANIGTGNRKVVRTFFQLLDKEIWVQMYDPTSELNITDEVVLDVESKPHVDALITNAGVVEKKDIVLIATVFDSLGNAFATSRTFVENIKPEEVKAISFIWSEPFATTAARIDISPLMVP